MSDQAFEAELRFTAEAIGQLAEDEGIFTALVEAHQKQDAGRYQEVLARLGLLPRCHLVCDWVCRKRCALACLALAGPPPQKLDVRPADLREFALLLGRLAENEELLRLALTALDGLDPKTYRVVIDRAGLEKFSHFFCQWICSIRCGLTCERVCPDVIEPREADPFEVIRGAAEVIGKAAQDEQNFAALVAAHDAQDAEKLRSVLERMQLLPFCRLICELLCGWRCVLVCVRLIPAFPPPKRVSPMKEMFAFARVTADIARRPGALEELADIVGRGDADAFSRLIVAHKLQRYAYQLCHWLCSFRCRWFCRLVCPPRCDITAPKGCVEEELLEEVDVFRGIEIIGTVAGGGCDHYTLEWRRGGTATWRSDFIRYPGSPAPAQGSCGVFNDVLGYLSTYPAVLPGPVEIRLRVFGADGSVICTKEAEFTLQRNLAWIRGIEGVNAAEPPGVGDVTAQLVDGSGTVRSFGTSLRIDGTAWVGGCEGRDIKRYTLAYHPDFVLDPTLPGFVQFWQVDYINGFQIAYGASNPVNDECLTSSWVRQRFCIFGSCVTIGNTLVDDRWSTQVPVAHLVEPVDPPTTPSPATWASKELPPGNCQSGRYTLRLTVEDRSGLTTSDLQHVWIDNKAIFGRITQFAGVAPCDTINLSQFAVGNGDCTQPWPATLLGIAFDEFIIDGDASVPSDNFGGYMLWIKKDGVPDPGSGVPIPGPGSPPWTGPLVGTSRVGTPDPALRCNTPPPFVPYPPEQALTLAVLDMRRLDAVCNPSESALTLPRKECCAYVITLSVWDTSVCPSLGGSHHIEHTFPVRICNDLPA